MSTWRSNPLKCSILFNWLGTGKTEKYILFYKITDTTCTLSGWDVCWHASVWTQLNKARKNFPCVWMAWYTANTQVVGGREFSKVYTQPRLGTPCKPSRVCISVLNSPNHSRVYIRLCKHRKSFSIICLNTISQWNLWTKLFSHIFGKRKHLS